MHNLMITATRHNEGKTAITLGATLYLKKRAGNIGYMKPLGKKHFASGGVHMDADAALVAQVCNLHMNIQHMSPVTLPSGFPSEQVDNKDNMKAVLDSYRAIRQHHEFIILEGTGHAAVGAVFGLSNASVARELDAKVLLISSGGVAQPVDEILINKHYFESHGVEVLGVVINKIFPHEINDLKRYTERILAKSLIPVLGYLPYQPELTHPTVMQVFESLEGELLCGSRQQLDVKCRKIAVGAMTPRNALKFAEPGMLLVVPGDREDLILSLTAAAIPRPELRLAGIVISGGLKPSDGTLDILKHGDVPVFAVKQDSFAIASQIKQLEVKINPKDTEKLQLIESMVTDGINFDYILEKLA